MDAPALEDLFRLACRGDEAAFAAIVQRLEPKILPYLRTRLAFRAPDTAGDLMQETWLRVWRKRDSFDPTRGHFEAWVWRIAGNLLVNFYRDSSRHGPWGKHEQLSEFIRAPRADGPEGRLMRHEAVRALSAAIQRLPSKFQSVVRLIELQELDYMETATMLHLPLGTVKSRLHRARAALKDILERAA